MLAGVLVCLVTLGIGGGVGSKSHWGVKIIACEWCGSERRLEVHHIQPQHVRPDLAMDTNNMVILCRTCHFTVGHKNDWKRVFTNVREVIREGRR
jgi:hypothetical protein